MCVDLSEKAGKKIPAFLVEKQQALQSKYYLKFLGMSDAWKAS